MVRAELGVDLNEAKQRVEHFLRTEPLGLQATQIGHGVRWWAAAVSAGARLSVKTAFGAAATLIGLSISALVIADTRVAVDVPVSVGRSLSAELYSPGSGAPAPAVIVLHTAAGAVESFDSQYARALAKEGFVALAVNYLHAQTTGGTRIWAPGITDDLAAVTKWLQARPEVAGKPLGTVGFSLGSHALLLAAREPAIKAVVVYYGAYNPRQFRSLKLPPTVRLPIDVAAEVRAPVLLFHGAADDEVPPSDARAMEAALKAAGKVVELVVYPGAHHRFDRGPVAGMRGERSAQGHTYRKNDAAAKDAFARTLAWLRKYLGS